MKENENIKFKENLKFKYNTHTIPDDQIINKETNNFDVELIKNHFIEQGRLTISQASRLLKDARKILSKEKNVVEVPNKTYIFGDTHGQFYDLIFMLSKIDLSMNRVVFTGDYVDRGVFSTENFLFLLVLKLNYPDKVILLRGNHESREMTRYFTYLMECEYKYNTDIYDLCIEVFDSLPLVAVIDNKVFCTHGGIGPDVKTIENINKIDRFQEIMNDEVMTQLMWSDPHNFFDINDKGMFLDNYKRGTAYFYGYKAVVDFLKKNNLTTIVRGHEVMERGYELKREYLTDIPSVITIFSAANYCDVYNNKGAYIFYDNHFFIKQVEGVEHPFVLPGFLDGISWSLPFIGEKLVEIFRGGLDKLGIKDSKSKEFEVAMALLREETEKFVELQEEESDVLSSTNLQVDPLEASFEEVKMLDSEFEKDISDKKGKSICKQDTIITKLEKGEINDISEVRLSKNNSKEILIDKKSSRK